MAQPIETSDWRREAERLLRARQWGAAQEILMERLKVASADAQAWVFLGESLENQGDRGSAWAAFDRAWMLDPQAAWAARVFARIGDAAGQPVSEEIASLLAVATVPVIGAILAKNEAENIVRCIEALQPAVDRVVVVDTGSTDQTVELAERAGAEVLQVEWQEDFGAARHAADAVLGEAGWVLWVDADEFLDPADRHVPRVVAGLFDTWDPPMLLRIVQVNHMGDRVEPNFDTTRMFPVGRGISWGGRIHEQVRSQENQPVQRAVVRIRVDHWGYDRDVMVSRNKYERNIRLLRAWAKDEPNNAAAWGFLGRDLFISGQLEEAVDALYRAETAAMADRTYGRTVEVRAVLCEALVKLHRLEEARVVAERAVQGEPNHPAGWYWKAQVALLQADERVKQALEGARKAQEVAPKYRGLVSFTPEIPKFLAPIAEADALKFQGRWGEALQKYQDALKTKPEHPGVMAQLQSLESQAKWVVEHLSKEV